jgi:protein transport protein SEC23
MDAEAALVQGMLGCGASLHKGGSIVSSNAVGAGRSSSYRISALDHSSTLCFFFEITAESKSADKAKANETFHIQFATHYLHWDGTWRKRITTIGRMWVSGQNPHELVMGFDQEAAAVMLARYCTWKMETEEEFDATRWIDRSLIRLCQRYG